MKKILIFVLALLMAVPVLGQKLSKEEKAAQQAALYETMIKSLEDRDWALVPTSYIDDDGVDNQLTDNSIFISYEKTNMFMQGLRVCETHIRTLLKSKSMK